MADFNELANTTLDVELLGKTYKMRRISMDTIFGKAETSVIATQMKRVQEMAKTLDGEDKASFLAKAMIESIPSGDQLNQMAAAYLKSVDGVKMCLVEALRKDQPGIESELSITELVEQEPDKIATIVSFIIGRSDKKSPVPLPSEAKQ